MNCSGAIQLALDVFHRRRDPLERANISHRVFGERAAHGGWSQKPLGLGAADEGPRRPRGKKLLFFVFPSESNKLNRAIFPSVEEGTSLPNTGKVDGNMLLYGEGTTKPT